MRTSRIAKAAIVFVLLIAHALPAQSASQQTQTGPATQSAAPAQSKDDLRKSGEADDREGMRLYREQTPGAERAAIEKFKQAAAEFEASGDQVSEVTALDNAGGICEILGDRKTALDYFQRALDLARSIQNGAGEGAALNNLGMIYAENGDNRRALDYFQQALPLRHAANDPPAEGITLTNIGKIYGDSGDKQKALEYCNKAYDILKGTTDRRDTASVMNNIGKIYADLGEWKKALDYYAQCLPIFKDMNDRTNVARTLSNIGSVHAHLGEEEEALSYFQQALEPLRATGARTAEGITLNNIGSIYDDLGEKQKALDYYQQALAAHREMGDRKEEAVSLNNIARLLGDSQKALDYFNQALELRRAVGDRDGEATTLNNIGAVYDDLGQKEEALDYYNQARPAFRAALDQDGVATTFNNAGVIYDELGERDKALQSFAQALPLFRAVGDPLNEANTLVVLMKIWAKAQNPPLAIYFGKQAIDRYQQVRRNIAGMPKEERESFLRLNEDAYRRLASLLISAGRLPEAQSVLDSLKLEEYSQFTQMRGDIGSAASPVAMTSAESSSTAEYERESAEIASIGEEWTQMEAKPSRTPEEDKRLDELSKNLAAANEQWEKFLDGLFKSFGTATNANARVDTIRGQTSSLQGIVDELGEGTVALYTLVLDDKLEILVITPTVRVAREVPVTKSTLRLKVFAFARALSAHQPDADVQKASLDLYSMLITPIEKDLAGAKAQTLVWSLDDVLRYVPMAALYDGKQYLVERYRTALITSASMSDLKDVPHVANWTGLAMGVSRNYENLGALTAVPGELDSVVRSAATAGSHGPVPGTIMLDDSFTQAAMESALAKHPPLVHIASHYVFHAGDDSKSWLLLGGKDATGGGGFQLTLADIRVDPRMDFRGVELLTLSGCQTAVGSTDSDGREIDGLGIVAQQKHAKAVMATLWPVDDASVGKLMATFYKTWITTPGMTKAEALRQAQLALLHGAKSGSGNSGQENYANPFYWAPFILIGNWK